MKTLYLPLIIVLMCMSSCKKDEIAKKHDDLNNSYRVWLNYKSSIHNSYSYTQNYGSVFGYNTEIKTAIKDGKFISRDLTLTRYHPDNTNKKDTLKQWHEGASNLNTHGIEAGDLLTIDDIYDQSRKVYLKTDVKKNMVIFEANNNGILSSCGYIPNGCQDDCFNGINISSITPL